jgi:hypothetical protein
MMHYRLFRLHFLALPQSEENEYASRMEDSRPEGSDQLADDPQALKFCVWRS